MTTSAFVTGGSGFIGGALVRRLVADGWTVRALARSDERAPLRFDSPALYSSTKARAEEAVIGANQDGLETVVVRPRFVWGLGDTTLLPAMTEMVRAGRFAWIGGGRQRTSTTHVDNAVEGLMVAAQRGAPGGVYFVTDGEPVVFRDFVTRLIETQGVTPPGRSLPAPLANAVATVGETAWRLLPLPGRPPLTRLAVWLSAVETTIDITRARTELGYAPVRTIDDGLEELRQP